MPLGKQQIDTAYRQIPYLTPEALANLNSDAAGKNSVRNISFVLPIPHIDDENVAVLGIVTLHDNTAQWIIRHHV